MAKPAPAKARPEATPPPERRQKVNHTDGGDWELELLSALLAFRSGDFSTRLPAGWTGVQGKIADAFNDVLIMSERRATEAERVSRVVGKEGRLRQRMAVTGMIG